MQGRRPWYPDRSHAIVRFWKHVRKGNKNECWPWTLSKIGKGYGQCRSKFFSTALAHRIAWELTNGPILDGLDALHKCDNPICCNPNHMFLGNDQDNVDDMISKGRSAHQLGTIARHIGEANGHTKLTYVQVRAIRSLYRLGVCKYKSQIGRIFGIHGGYVKALVEYRFRKSS